MFPTQEMAEEFAKMLGCEGSHPHETKDQGTYYMPCKTHPIELEEVRVNESCPDGFEHRMPDGSYMCGKSMNREEGGSD